jgi:hypothetical protein
MIFFGYSAYTQAKAYEKTTSSLVSQMSVEKLAKFQLKELVETFSLGFYKNDKKKNLEKIRDLGAVYKKRSQE